MRKDFIIREIAGEIVIIPVNEAAVHFQGIMSLNESGKLLWDRLQEDVSEDTLIAALLEDYDTTHDVAKHDVSVFLDQLRKQNILQETE
ncbi:MAG: PqqD family protein [Clostridiales bacterium]|nr:PqqD family protein [Clostridiales bacterium]